MHLDFLFWKTCHDRWKPTFKYLHLTSNLKEKPTIKMATPAKDRDCRRARQEFGMGRYNLKELRDMEVKKNYQANISRSFR